MVPFANCFSNGPVPVTIDLTGLNLQSIPTRVDGLSVEFPKVHFIFSGIGLMASSGSGARACLPHPPVTSARVVPVQHSRVGVRVEDTELV